MGDKILKYLILSVTLLSSSLFAEKTNNELEWVDAQIEAIKPPRSGASLRSIAILKNPFVFLKKKKSKAKESTRSSSPIPPAVVGHTSVSGTNTKGVVPVLHTTHTPKNYKRHGLQLRAIINNAALINNKWYKLGQYVRGYKITKISLHDVVLQNSSGSFKLTTRTKKFHSRTTK